MDVDGRGWTSMDANATQRRDDWAATDQLIWMSRDLLFDTFFQKELSRRRCSGQRLSTVYLLLLATPKLLAIAC